MLPVYYNLFINNMDPMHSSSFAGARSRSSSPASFALRKSKLAACDQRLYAQVTEIHRILALNCIYSSVHSLAAPTLRLLLWTVKTFYTPIDTCFNELCVDRQGAASGRESAIRVPSMFGPVVDARRGARLPSRAHASRCALAAPPNALGQ